MTAQTNSDIIGKLEDLESRIRAVEDADAIRNLKARYAELCDDDYNPDGIAALFVDDAVWESGPLGRFEGKESIRDFFRGASEIFTFAIHYSLNPQIEVTGDTARARWYLFMPCTVGDGDQAMWRAGIDDEEYVRVDGHWMFKSKKSTGIFNTPFDSGWAKVRSV
jgi:ketosteroid isomerase-like protein|tara:strand:+ start:501 stop:995 length:495 start_codon:yes stop_codon:yes gene_type:complete